MPTDLDDGERPPLTDDERRKLIEIIDQRAPGLLDDVLRDAAGALADGRNGRYRLLAHISRGHAPEWHSSPRLSARPRRARKAS